MIFVTVGTHEQSFDRLIKKIDELIENKLINEEVFIQKGYTDYEVKNCKSSKLIDYRTMEKMLRKSRLVKTHGGPATIMQAWQVNKIPIVVPRNPKFDEHVDGHQIAFAKKLESEEKIIAIYDIYKISDVILNSYDNRGIVYKKNSNFVNKFHKILTDLHKGD